MAPNVCMARSIAVVRRRETNALIIPTPFRAALLPNLSIIGISGKRLERYPVQVPPSRSQSLDASMPSPWQ
jgi:hypothetical protein